MTGTQGVIIILMVLGGIWALLTAEVARIQDRFSRHPKLVFWVFWVAGWAALSCAATLWWVWRPQ